MSLGMPPGGRGDSVRILGVFSMYQYPAAPIPTTAPAPTPAAIHLHVWNEVDLVGLGVGAVLGDSEGDSDGLVLGAALGTNVGESDGATVGDCDGLVLGVYVVWSTPRADAVRLTRHPSQRLVAFTWHDHGPSNPPATSMSV